MYGKIQITGEISIKTGMHIGASDAFAAIGAVDSSVMRDSYTNDPIIPGSSLKGKMRSLLARALNQKVSEPANDHDLIKRLFGYSEKNSAYRSRLIFADLFPTEASKATLKQKGLNSLTEIKFENTISRLTAVANPRQIERVIRGSAFDLDIIYEASKEDEILDDMKTLKQGFTLLAYDYIGGHGSRGYGKITIHDLCAECVAGDIPQKTIDDINKILQ